MADKVTEPAKSQAAERNGVRYKDHAVLSEIAADSKRVIEAAFAAHQLAGEEQPNKKAGNIEEMAAILDDVIEGTHATFKTAAEEQVKKAEAEQQNKEEKKPIDDDARRKAALKEKMKKKLSAKRDPAVAAAENLSRIDISNKEVVKTLKDLVDSHNRMLAVLKDNKEVIERQENTMKQFVALMLRGKDSK